MEVILTGENSMDVQVGDSIITKKPHPCGNSTFAVRGFAALAALSFAVQKQF